MSASDREIALAGLLRCLEPPVCAPVYEWAVATGAEDAWEAIIQDQAPPEVAAAASARVGRFSHRELTQRAVADVASADRAGARLIGPGDANWPADAFAPLEWVAPYERCRDAAPPLGLYWRGVPWADAPSAGVAIVGARAATGYGTRVATEIAADAANAGYVVVSGGAFGIDVAAHRGVLAGVDDLREPAQSKPQTIAVMACGIDRCYPVAHRDIIDLVAVNGAVVSEYPPGAVPARYRFLVRNRLIAALAAVTVVVEAGYRSGSLNTATTAANLGRTVCAVPGPVSSALSLGPHELIRNRKAELVTGWDDISGFLGPLQPGPSVHRPAETVLDSLPPEVTRVYDALPAHAATTVDQLAIEAAGPIAGVLAALARLEVCGLATHSAGQWRRLR